MGGSSAAAAPSSSAAADAPPAKALPPVEVRNGSNVDVTLAAEPTTVTSANGDTYPAWTFDGQVRGPVIRSAFHVVGAVFDTVEPSGSPDAALHGLQAWTVAPRDAARVELRLSQTGKYPFVS